MTLKSVLIDSLSPHLEELSSWDDVEIECLFLGLGNIHIYNSEDVDKLEDLSSTFRSNAVNICLALNELELGSEWSETEFYWIIQSQAGCIREDLSKAMELAGYVIDGWDNEDLEKCEWQGGLTFA